MKVKKSKSGRDEIYETKFFSALQFMFRHTEDTRTTNSMVLLSQNFLHSIEDGLDVNMVENHITDEQLALQQPLATEQPFSQALDESSTQSTEQLSITSTYWLQIQPRSETSASATPMRRPTSKKRKTSDNSIELQEQAAINCCMALLSSVTLRDEFSSFGKLVSDIPVPYGRTIALKHKGDKIDIVEWNKNKKQDVLVAIVISNCSGKRMKYVKELSKHLKVDMYGRCGTLPCPGHYHTDCKNTSAYKFYLSFENSLCDEYITEKVWWNGYHKNAIPIVMGGSKLSYQQSLPPKSYIDVTDFSLPKDLAVYLLHLNSSLGELESFFEWKRDFKVLNEHGYFQSLSVHYCRLCEALNYNSKKTKIYSNLTDFLSIRLCN
ncbi:hypothetical protein RN001_013807 [Aquatica leii]|uniref:Fucosyltransferase n=1 Tax=Aquatica leii TaxID=1421715 RepID=A0AAN7PS77_9COLE|nr:hypothetical protein RN001_013807 [Aquatica leii]